MTFLSKILRNAAAGVGVAETPEELSVLKKPGCAAAIWRRQIPARVESWLSDMPPENLPSGRFILRPSAVSDSLRHMCKMAETPPGAQQDWLVEDIAHMAQVFADLMLVDYLRLRLDAIAHNACRKFHIDSLTARLVCTYRGQGTQYGISTDGQDPARVFQVGTGAPIILRGTLWPEDPPSGLLHRSPPIEGTGETRLLLVLDPIYDPSEPA